MDQWLEVMAAVVKNIGFVAHTHMEYYKSFYQMGILNLLCSMAYFPILHVWCFAYTYINVPKVCLEAAEGRRRCQIPPGTTARGGWELPCRCWELNVDPQLSVTLIPGLCCSALASLGTVHMWYTYIHADKTLEHIKLK